MSFFRRRSPNLMRSIESLSDVKKETAMPTKVFKKIPRTYEGVDGDKRLVTSGKKKFLYNKILGKWWKTELTEEGKETSTTTESTSGVDTSGGGGTTGTPVSVQFNYQYDQGASDEMEGWSSYLLAAKETPDTGNHTVAQRTDYAHNGMANGSFMRDTSTNTSTLFVPDGLTSSNPTAVEYFSTEQISGSGSYYLFAVNYAGEISAVRSRTPSSISVTGEATSATSITLTMQGNTEITESVRLYWKTTGGSYGGSDYVDIAIASNDRKSDHTFTHSFTASNAGLDPSASTSYTFKTEGRNTASQQNVGQAVESESITTPSATAAWNNVPSDFDLTAFGLEANTGSYYSTVRTVNIVNGATGNNSTTISLNVDSGSVLSPGIAISKDGDPGSAGDNNSGTGWASGNTASQSIDVGNPSGTIYIRFRHQFKNAYIGQDANVSVTLSNTSGSLADNTDLDITMINEEGFSP